MDWNRLTITSDTYHNAILGTVLGYQSHEWAEKTKTQDGILIVLIELVGCCTGWAEGDEEAWITSRQFWFRLWESLNLIF